jgi:uncharacterized protein
MLRLNTASRKHLCELPHSRNCGAELDGVILVAGQTLVGMLFEMKIFSAENEEHAGRIAKSMIGKALGSIPLKVIEVEELD